MFSAPTLLQVWSKIGKIRCNKHISHQPLFRASFPIWVFKVYMTIIKGLIALSYNGKTIV